VDSLLNQYVDYINTRKAGSGYRVCMAHEKKCGYSICKVFTDNGGVDVMASGMTKNEVHYYLRGLSDGVNPLSLGAWDESR
jgi:hypothetical protein